MRHFPAVAAAISLAALPPFAPCHADAAQPRGRTTDRAADRAPTLAEDVRARIESTFTVLSDDFNFDRASMQLATIFDQVIAYAPADAALVRDAAFAVRFVDHLRQVDAPRQRQVFDLLRENQDLARTLVFLVKPGDSVPQVYDILLQLHRADARAVTSLPALAAAVCVVHDRPRMAKASPVEARRTIDPVEVFRYFSRNANQMVMHPRTTAAELLVYVVDVTAEVEELNWALSRHRGDRMVQKRYGDLRYDTGHFKYNRPKKISEHPYTLENLQRHGGVCEEQGYYAAHVARAIGVPAVYITGAGAGLAHAWVGVVQLRSNNPVWYMEEGRDGEYRNLRGIVTDPQSNRRLPDDHAALSAAVARTPIADRHSAVAYIDAAKRIWSHAGRNSKDWPPPAIGEGDQPQVAAADNALGLALLQRAAGAAPSMPEVWLTLGEAARNKRLDRSDRTRWFDAFFNAVGNDHPDFCFAILSEMITSVDNPAEQAAAWDWVLRRYHRRNDLCAEAILGRARAWRDGGDSHQAYTSYVEVVNRYGNDAATAVIALREAEQLLIAGNRQGHVLEMYRQAFQRMRRPSGISAQFYSGTNYYQIGDRYATLLEAAGHQSDAERIRRQIAAGAPRD